MDKADKENLVMRIGELLEEYQAYMGGPENLNLPDNLVQAEKELQV